MSKKSARKKELERQKRNRLTNKSYTVLENNYKLADDLYNKFLRDYERNENKYGNMNWGLLSKKKFLASMDAMGQDLAEDKKPNTLKRTYDALLDRATFGQTHKQYKLAWTNNPELRKKYNNDITKFLGKGEKEYYAAKHEKLRVKYNAMFKAIDENIHFNYDYFKTLSNEDAREYLRHIFKNAGLRLENYIEQVKQVEKDVSNYFTSTWFYS